MSIAFSVDLEPNKDGSFDGVEEAMDWYDDTVSKGTVYTTYRVATQRPNVVDQLATNNEIGVHVHPQEFGHEHDNLAALSPERQRELIAETRVAVADATGVHPDDITAFRAGRHKASPQTLSILADLGFEVDASVNVRYRDYMPETVLDRIAPFEHESGVVELPTTYGRPPLLSRVKLRTGLGGNITATAHTLRTDRPFCSGFQAISWLLRSTDSVVSMYMHPYDATTYHTTLTNAGDRFRQRIEILFNETDRSFVTASEACESIR